jgi:hypothetical protein
VKNRFQNLPFKCNLQRYTAFPFFYINPKGFPALIRRFAGAHLTDDEIEAMVGLALFTTL